MEHTKFGSIYTTIQKLYKSWSAITGNLNLYRNHSTKYKSAAKIKGEDVTNLWSYGSL